MKIIINCCRFLGVVFASLLWGYLTWISYDSVNYRYFYVVDWQHFTVFILITVVPLIPLAFGAVFLIKHRDLLSYIALFFAVLLMFASLFIQSFLFLGTQLAESNTTATKNFGKYDAEIHKYLELNPVLYFPEEIPNNAQNVEYQYRYANDASTKLFISVSWQYNEEDFQTLLDYMLKKAGYWQKKYGVYSFFAEDCNLNPLDLPYIFNAVYLNDDLNAVEYVICTRGQCDIAQGQGDGSLS